VPKLFFARGVWRPPPPRAFGAALPPLTRGGEKGPGEEREGPEDAGIFEKTVNDAAHLLTGFAFRVTIGY